MTPPVGEPKVMESAIVVRASSIGPELGILGILIFLAAFLGTILLLKVL